MQFGQSTFTKGMGLNELAGMRRTACSKSIGPCQNARLRPLWSWRIAIGGNSVTSMTQQSVKPQPTPGEAGFSRKTKTRERALSTASQILLRDGFARLTMERVAAEAGVAKTTLYRRWPTKAALCMELYLAVAGRELQDPDTGDVASDLRHIVNTVVRLQTRTVAGPAFIGLIAEAQSNPESSAAFLADFAERRRDITRRVLIRAIHRGEIRAETDVD